MRNYPESIENKIGFDSVRTMVERHCLSDLGKGRCRDMAFSTDYALVSRLLAETAEMRAIHSSSADFPLNSVHDLTYQLRLVKTPGTHMPENELLRLRASLGTLADIAAFFRTARNEEGNTPYPFLDKLAAGIRSFPEILSEIDRVIDKFGQVRDNASPQLASIRGSLASMAGAINTTMRRVVARLVREGVLDADTSPSIRDGRAVIPVAPMNKRKIPGIVHDESASGKTYFIEPAEVVETGNRLRELELEERREVVRILVELTDRLRPYIPEMLDSYEILADFDFINAKSLFAADCGGEMPSLHDDMQLELYHACHPVLRQSLAKQGKDVVPLDISLSPEKRILIISGPNAGGKSVTLKTIAIVQYMTQCGLLPPVYGNSHIGMCHSVFIDIGDDQSMENDLSTYSSHLRNMKWLVNHADRRTMVLIDEFGSGTEPTIGGAIAQAVLARLVELGVWGVITTHFNNLKQFANETPALVNGSMLYDRQKMQPLFKLSVGSPGSSFAIEIARKTGLPDNIISEAERIVGSDYVKMDRYMLDIARDKRYWENKRLDIKRKEKRIEELIEKYEGDAEQLRLKRREIIDDARTEAKRMLSESNAAIERTIHDIKEANAEKERTKEARRRLLEKKESLEGLEESTGSHPLLEKGHKARRKKDRPEKRQPQQLNLVPGDHVLLDGSGSPGTVMEVDGDNATVAFGMLKTQVKVSRLVPTMRKPQKASGKTSLITSTSEASRERQLNFHPEIDVRGMRVDEALQAITYFIDDAVQFNASRVRILHGTGTGALRQALREYLGGQPAVTSFHDEDVRFGGAGITVVDLA